MNKTKGKILLFWPYFPPHSGAAAVRGGSFLKFFKKNNFTTQVISIKRRKQNYNDEINLLPLELSFSSIFKDFILTFKSIRLISPSHIIISIPPITMGVYAAMSSYLLNKKIIIDSRDLNLESKKNLYSKLKKKLWKICFNLANNIFVTSETQKKFLITDYSIEKTKIMIVQNGVSKEIIDSQIKDKIIEYDIAFLGTLVPERNLVDLESFLDYFFKLNKKSSAVFIGVDFENKDSVVFVENIKKKAYSKQITFKKETSPKKAFSLLIKSKIGLVSLINGTNSSYQIPTKIYEYFAAGVAVAALIPESAKEIENLIKKTDSGCFSNNPKILAEKIFELLKNKKRLERLRNNSKLAAPNYEREKALEKIKKIFI